MKIMQEPEMMDSMMLRIVNKNTARTTEIAKKQDNLYDSLLVLEKTTNLLVEKINRLEKEIIFLKKSNELIKEAERL